MAGMYMLSVLVKNKPGVLMRIATFFVRRGFNTKSLVVGETEYSEILRMMIIVKVDEAPFEQATK